MKKTGIELDMANVLDNLASKLSQSEDISIGSMTMDEYIETICALRYAIGILRGIAGGKQ